MEDLIPGKTLQTGIGLVKTVHGVVYLMLSDVEYCVINSIVKYVLLCYTTPETIHTTPRENYINDFFGIIICHIKNNMITPTEILNQ